MNIFKFDAETIPTIALSFFIGLAVGISFGKTTGQHFKVFGQTEEKTKVLPCSKELDECLLKLKPAIKQAEKCEN
jgi:hypothetical protein